VQPALIEPENRRFTCSSLKYNGYKPVPILEKVVRPKKKARAKMLVLPKDGCAISNSDKGNDYIQIPATPIEVMQKVGRELGIEPEELAKEKLVADVSSSSTTTSTSANY
jgi:hypothetical protein